MKSWRTTLAGFLLAGLNIYANGGTPKQIGVSVALAALGMMAKDSGVSHSPDPLPKAEKVTHGELP